MTAFGICIHKYGSSRIFADLSSCFGAGFGKSFLVITGRTKHFINAFGEELIVDNAEKGLAKAFAECVDEVLGTSGNDEFIRILSGEFYCIPNHIAP